jgi:co-chaperonin GroES (HSP10)
VLIKRKDIEKIGSIIVPKTSQEGQANLGEVVSAGPDCDFVKEGDVVTFGRYAPLRILKEEMQYYGFDMEFEPDTTYFLINEADLLCIIAEEKPNKMGLDLLDSEEE